MVMTACRDGFAAEVRVASEAVLGLESTRGLPR